MAAHRRRAHWLRDPPVATAARLRHDDLAAGATPREGAGPIARADHLRRDQYWLEKDHRAQRWPVRERRRSARRPREETALLDRSHLIARLSAPWPRNPFRIQERVEAV